jgi:pSer/pThr/pTyr-binding forkhead associated (FHA) protein
VAGKLTLYPARGASRHFILRDGESRQAGRDPGANDLVLDDPRVSARHARLEWTGRGWSLHDLGSKNGTFVAGSPALGTSLEDEDWVSFGGLLARFELVTEEQIRALESERARRLQTSVEIRQELARERDPRALLQRLLQSVLSVTGAERGLVLLIGPGGTLKAEIASGFDPATLGERFEGSLGAIERVLETGESVVASDAPSHTFLGKRPSVLELGITTLACVPLRSDDRVAGLIYVDGRKRGGVFTDLDLEFLEALAANVSVVLSTVRIDREIRELLGGSGESDPDGRPFLEELERRVAEIARGRQSHGLAARGAVPSS